MDDLFAFLEEKDNYYEQQLDDLENAKRFAEEEAQKAKEEYEKAAEKYELAKSEIDRTQAAAPFCRPQTAQGRERGLDIKCRGCIWRVLRTLHQRVKKRGNFTKFAPTPPTPPEGEGLYFGDFVPEPLLQS